MPTREVLASFWRDWDRLTPQQQLAFRDAIARLIAGLAEGGQGFHPRLRVKRVQGYPGVWEMSWAPDGRATFQYGDEIHAGEAHIIWRRIGTHAIFRRP
jgi:mRNA-degrading endonuclease YafQ of YafQ-DinJ toxin-antitoxin module